jgi:hypothetical protein
MLKALNGLDEAYNKAEEVSQKPPTPSETIKEKKKMEESYQEPIKEKIVEKTGIPKDNLIVAKPKPLVTKEEQIKEIDEQIEKQQKPKCSKCDLPKDADLGDKGCIYEDCPEGKHKKEEEPFDFPKEMQKNPDKVAEVEDWSFIKPDGSQSSRVAEGEEDDPFADEDAQIKKDQEEMPEKLPDKEWGEAGSESFNDPGQFKFF